MKTALRYNQLDDEKVTGYYNRVKNPRNIEKLTPEDKAKVWFDKFFTSESHLKTFKTGIDVILPPRRKDEDIGYL